MSRRWRTVLFTPAERPDRVEKAWRSGTADVVVADLEDAVLPDRKDAARPGIAKLLQDVQDADCQRAVRINPPGTPWHEADLKMVLAHKPDVVVVPKASQPDETAALTLQLRDARIAAVLILENAAGILAARDLAMLPGVTAVAFGAEDLAADAGMERTPGNDEVTVPRSLVALAAAAADVHAIDMITADYQDLDRVAREAEEARRLGYAGKMVIHPAQVAPVHDAFRADPDQVAWAQKVVAGAEDGDGVFVVDGEMIDAPLIKQAKRILARTDA